MSYTTTGTQTSSSQIVTAFFDDRSEAQAAVDRIVRAGVSPADIKLVAGADTATTTTTTSTHERGFFESLGDLFMPDEDRHTYAEGLRRGGYLVSVPTTYENRDTILDILDDEGTVDMDQREASWRSEGWSGTETGYVAPAATARSQGTATTGASYASSANSGALGSANTGSATDRDGTIEVAEENLRLGKRDVSHGRVRVRSYVVEEAVSADVNLRSERVELERRVVDRPVTGADAAFRDQTIELEETAEEAVVSKEARVKEEIDLRKVGSERVETVSDTVRRTEVDIEDERARGLPGTTDVRTGTTTSRRDI